MGKSLHEVFKDLVNDLNNLLSTFRESVSEVSHFISEPRSFAEVIRLRANVKKALLKSTVKEIKNTINNHTFLMYDPYKGDPVTPCMDV